MRHRAVRRSGARALLAVSCLLAGCSTASPTATPLVVGPASGPLPVIVSTEQVVGDNRFVFSYVDSSGQQAVAQPNRVATVQFFDLAKSATTPVANPVPAFIWAIDNLRGVYVVNVTFSEAGHWAADFGLTGPGLAVPVRRLEFDVAASGSVAAVGSRAPALHTPTAAEVGGVLNQISTDAHPDPAFYRMSLDAAIAGHLPFVLAIASPSFCTSAQCAPVLERLKTIAPRWPAIAFLHVEPYQMTFTAGRLQPVLDAQSGLQTDATSTAYGLRTEPWVFVVDGTGVIRASFEGTVGTDELEAALRALE